VALIDDYQTAVAAFVASPSETTKRAVLGARMKLPDAVSGDGGSAQLPNISTLETTLDAMLKGATATSSTNRRRLIQTGLSHG
jgi:hypothetical protein